MSNTHDTYESVPLSDHAQETGESRSEGSVDNFKPQPRRLRTIVLALLATVLVWQITTRSLVAYLADTAPEAALNLRPGDATALINMSESELKLRQRASIAQKSSTPTTAVKAGLDSKRNVKADAKIRAWAEAALIDEPLNAQAIGILGRIAATAENPDKEQTARLMAAAARFSLRENGAIFWLMQNSFEKGEYDKTIDFADMLLNTSPQLARYIVPFLARVAEISSAAPKLENLLASNPKWRTRFFSLLPKSISNARTPLGLLLNLKDTRAPATTGEIRVYLDFLLASKFYEIAYYTWLQFLSPEQLGKAGYLFNGGFETDPGGLPFDWVINQGSGVTIDIAAHPDEDDQRALLIEFGHGRVKFRDVVQMTMLAPGTYRLEGRYKGQIIGRRGLVWRIACLGSARQPLGKSPMFVGVARKWKAFETSFTVPGIGCRAQQIKLQFEARSASEQLVTGAAWYDDLKISRASNFTKISQ